MRLASILIPALGALPLASQTTGTLQGRVLAALGGPLPGIQVQVRGPGLQGGRSTATRPDGSFWFAQIPPGPVEVTATDPVHGSSRVGVQVGLGATSTVEIRLASATVEVVDAPALLEAVSGATFTGEDYGKLPAGRDFATIALLAPGVSPGGLSNGLCGLRVYGATGTENAYLVDGIDTTGVELGVQGRGIPMEFVQEFQVKTGGYEAEFGRSTGGIVNVITRSGGNTFTGDVFTYLESAGLQARDWSSPCAGAPRAASPTPFPGSSAAWRATSKGGTAAWAGPTMPARWTPG